MNEIIAAGMVISAGILGWFARRVLDRTPATKGQVEAVEAALNGVAARLARVETKLESRSVDSLWKEHRDLAKTVARAKAAQAQQEGVISQLAPLVNRLDAYLRSVQGGNKP